MYTRQLDSTADQNISMSKLEPVCAVKRFLLRKSVKDHRHYMYCYVEVSIEMAVFRTQISSLY